MNLYTIAEFTQKLENNNLQDEPDLWRAFVNIIKFLVFKMIC